MGQFSKRFLLFLSVGVAVGLMDLIGCTGVRLHPRTEEIWYPSYSEFRIHDHQLIVFVYGYGGAEESFEFFPHLISANPNRTILYFTYDTSLLAGKTTSIGVAASQLRSFLEENIFRFRTDQKIDFVCHSTGCIIAKQYILDNPFTHRIRRLALAGAPNYGAYWAEASSWWKRKLPFAQGDKQIEELKPGSFTLFHLQERWHCLYERHLRKPIRPDACKEARSRDIFGNIISIEIDKRYERGKFRLPETMVVVGTNSWDTWGRSKFSDWVVRFESAMFDRRFLCMDGPPTSPRSTCSNPLVLFVDCWHIEFFNRDKCGGEVLEALDAFLECRGDHGTGCEPNKEKLRDIIHYRQKEDPEKKQRVRSYLTSLDIAALWVHVRVAEEAEDIGITDSTGAALDRSGAPFIPFGIYEADVLDAVRVSHIDSKHRIYFYKYVTIPKSSRETGLSIQVFPVRNSARVGGPITATLRTGMTTILDCGWVESRFSCENYTPDEYRLCFFDDAEQTCI